MTARIFDWPRDLHWTSREPLTGPRSRSAGSSESISGFVQTFASPFGLWRWQLSFPPLRGEAFRRYRGMVLALHGGANAVRMPFCDPDGLRRAEMGITTTDRQIRDGVPWGDGRPWANGHNWRTGRPIVGVASNAPAGANIVCLQSTSWGASLDIGDMIGFGPFYFGLHFVTQRLSPGEYMIWPPLRRALALSDFATLTPVMAMRLESESSASAGRGASFADALTMTLVEIEDADVREYYL